MAQNCVVDSSSSLFHLTQSSEMLINRHFKAYIISQVYTKNGGDLFLFLKIRLLTAETLVNSAFEWCENSRYTLKMKIHTFKGTV